MFLEQSHALLREGGRLGMIVPSGVYTDKGTTALRELFLNHCNWQWLFGFDNRERIFDIHREFKFCSLIIQKGSETNSIRTAFMHRNVDDWDQAERHVLAYPKNRVINFSPKSLALVEVKHALDLKALDQIYKFAGVFGIPQEFRREIDFSVSPSGLKRVDQATWFTNFENSPVVSGPDGSVFYPVWQGAMIGQLEGFAAYYEQGAGNRVVWKTQILNQRVLRPQFLLNKDNYKQHAGYARLVIRRITNATNARSLISAIIPNVPSSDMLPVLQTFSDELETNLWTCAVLNSFIFDWVVRLRFSGSSGAGAIDPYFMADLPGRPNIQYFSPIEMIAKLCLQGAWFSPIWIELGKRHPILYKKPLLFAETAHEWLRLRIILDTVISDAYKLETRDLKWIFRDCDYPKSTITTNTFSRMLDSKGFWRVDKDKDPELRHTVLSLIAFQDLQEKGLEVFLSQNDDEGWMIPETIRLADYGLGHDDRAQEHQPVASRLGPRFYDWQLNEDVTRSWEECEAHAELIRRIVPIEVTTVETDTSDGLAAPVVPSGQQMKLF
jgi:hypothetical protein